MYYFRFNQARFPLVGLLCVLYSMVGVFVPFQNDAALAQPTLKQMSSSTSSTWTNCHLTETSTQTSAIDALRGRPVVTRCGTTSHNFGRVV